MKLYLEDGVFIDTARPIDISIPLFSGGNNLTAWYLSQPRFEPVNENGFNGSVAAGGSVNFRNIYFNPHGHGTHTECLGHITEKVFSVNETFKEFFCYCKVVSLTPETFYNRPEGKEDRIIRKTQVADALKGVHHLEALVIRTLPNEKADKFYKCYSNTNPPYFEQEVVEILNDLGVKHFLVDLPSVDRESDEGKLAFHHRYWGVPENPDYSRTITELIYVDELISDGTYILELQLAPFENDASPSRPVLYQIERSQV